MKRIANLIFLSILSVTTAACIQLPTATQTSVDLRPQLAFRLSNPSLDGNQLLVFVDGLNMGVVANYLVDRQALRVLSGTHELKIMQADRVVLQERLYIGDGMMKIIVVN